MIVITETATLGPFKDVLVLGDRLVCDGSELPFSVIGNYEISNDDSLLPQSPPVYDRDQLKRERDRKVEAIRVTTLSGKTFDGDEISQTRMARAIVAMKETNTPSTPWVLADNTPTTVTAAELVEALALAGTAQSAVWVI